jgi:hypothetical protein
MRNFWNWAREVNWLAVLAVVLLLAAITVGVWGAVVALNALLGLGIVLAIGSVGLAILGQ